MNLEEVTETDMDDEFFNEDADMEPAGPTPPSKRKRNPSLKEVTSMGGSLAITVSTGSQESSAPPLPSPNPQRSPGIILGVEEAKPSSPGVLSQTLPPSYQKAPGTDEQVS
ncbi:hypothetical protein Pmani_036615 [Petrolisthes manimaculis]|uniref:Uncharacterized protein n=2 Tax=Petrolisthes manimaculis TaxID=1843537 RepID=A0AAE1NJD8_9EUCA|nr:hypothetical protein Pmani_036615 [Petrolisthes manimaculis]